MRTALDIFTIVAVVAGAVFYLAGTVGLLRFPDVYTRLHALTKADNLGLGLVVLGLLPQVTAVVQGLKLLTIWLLVMLSSAVVSQLIARAARRRERQRAAPFGGETSRAAGPPQGARPPGGEGRAAPFGGET